MDTFPEATVKLKTIGVQLALAEFGVILSPDRIKVEWDITAVIPCLRVLLHIATQEETISEIPSGWFQAFKARWLMNPKWVRLYPKWVRRWVQPKMSWIVAVHKFPELDVPDSVMGREFVHIRVVPPDALERQPDKNLQPQS